MIAQLLNTLGADLRLGACFANTATTSWVSRAGKHAEYRGWQRRRNPGQGLRAPWLHQYRVDKEAVSFYVDQLAPALEVDAPTEATISPTHGSRRTLPRRVERRPRRAGVGRGCQAQGSVVARGAACGVERGRAGLGAGWVVARWWRSRRKELRLYRARTRHYVPLV